MHVSRRLSPERRDDRYAEERRQGEQIVADDLERVWGWSGPAGTIRAQRRADFLISAGGPAPGGGPPPLRAGNRGVTPAPLPVRCAPLPGAPGAAGPPPRRAAAGGPAARPPPA